MSESINIAVHNQSIEIGRNFKQYVMDIISNHFDNLEKVHGAVITIKSFKADGETSNYLQPFYHFPQPNEDTKYNKIKENLHSTFIDDDKLLFSFYKNAGCVNDSLFILTKDHKNIYESIETRINNCKVIDSQTVREYNVKNLSKVGDERCQCEHGKCDACKVRDISGCILPSQLMDYFETKYLIPKGEENWLLIVFPYFFMSKLIGAYSVVLKGEFEIDVLEDYIMQLQKAKAVFYRSIINNIAINWMDKNIDNGNKTPRFINYLKYFIELSELSQEFQSKGESLFKSIESVNSSNKKDFRIYYPHTSKNSKNTLIVSIEYEGKLYFFEYHINNCSLDKTMRIKSFELVSHIQWLWEIWSNNSKSICNGK